MGSEVVVWHNKEEEDLKGSEKRVLKKDSRLFKSTQNVADSLTPTTPKDGLNFMQSLLLEIHLHVIGIFQILCC